MSNRRTLPKASGDSGATRDRLISAAEKLFAVRGVDSVSLVEIGLAAAQKNRSAVQYHFGDKAGVIGAIRDKHQPPIEAERQRRLAALEADPESTLRGFVGALVEPLADHVRRAPGGPEYLLMSADLLGHPEFSNLWLQRLRHPTGLRLMQNMMAFSQALPQEVIDPRMLLVTGMLFHGLADHARGGLVEADQWDQIVDNLTTCIVAVIEAPAAAQPAAPSRRSS